MFSFPWDTDCRMEINPQNHRHEPRLVCRPKRQPVSRRKIQPQHPNPRRRQPTCRQYFQPRVHRLLQARKYQPRAPLTRVVLVWREIVVLLLTGYAWLAAVHNRLLRRHQTPPRLLQLHQARHLPPLHLSPLVLWAPVRLILAVSVWPARVVPLPPRAFVSSAATTTKPCLLRNILIKRDFAVLIPAVPL